MKLIVLGKIIRPAIHNIGHPLPSGVPTLVLHGASQGVCHRCLLVVTRRLIKAGGTRVLLAALVAVPPAVVSRERFFRRSRTRRTTRFWRSTRHPFSRCLHQLLVCGGQCSDRVRQRQVGHRELLQHSGVVGRRKRQVVECNLQAIERCRWIRGKNTVHPPERLASPEARI